MKFRDDLEAYHSYLDFTFVQNGQPKLIWVDHIGCNTGYTAESPAYLLMLSPGQPQGGSIFCGTKVSYSQSDPDYKTKNYYNKFTRQRIDSLGLANNLAVAKELARNGTYMSPSEVSEFFVSYGNFDQHAWFNWPRIDLP